MKNINTYIKEGYENASQRVLRAITITEPIVKKSLEAKGYIIDDSTRDEDFQGIDLKVTNPKTNKKTIIDVKCSEEKNWNTTNFLFTIKSNKGKHYKNKKTEYVAFINFPTDEIVIVDIKKLSPLIDNTLPRKGNGEYVLLNKEEVKKLGNSIPIVK